jgi:transposase
MDLPAIDQELVTLKLQQLEQLSRQQEQVEARMQDLYDGWPEAQWLDEIRGIGMLTAVSMLAHIGPIQRFATAEDLIGYAGLAPGIRQSDATLIIAGSAEEARTIIVRIWPGAASDLHWGSTPPVAEYAAAASQNMIGQRAAIEV